MPHNCGVSEQPLTEAEQRIARRYPPPRIPRAAWWIAGGLLIPVLVAGWLWIATSQANRAVTASVHTFEIADDRVDAVITVQRPDPSRAATCEVFAQAVNFERVGEISAPVPPSTRTSDTIAVTIQTYRRATAIDVGDCTIVD